MNKINYLSDYFKYLDNPIEALKFKFGFKNKVNVIIKNKSTEIKLKNIFSINRLMHFIPIVSSEKFEELINYINEIDNDKELVTIDNINYYNIYNTKFQQTHNLNYSVCIEEYFSDDE